jgi:hypothetical protein
MWLYATCNTSKKLKHNLARTKLELTDRNVVPAVRFCFTARVSVAKPSVVTSKLKFYNISVRFAVFTAVVMKSTIFWDITPCSPLSVNRRFGGAYRLLLSRWFLAQLVFSTLKMEAICSSETSVDTQQTTRRCIPEDGTHHCERFYERNVFCVRLSVSQATASTGAWPVQDKWSAHAQWMSRAVTWRTGRCSCPFGLLFYPEDGRSTLLRNVCNTASHPRRVYPSLLTSCPYCFVIHLLFCITHTSDLGRRRHWPSLNPWIVTGGEGAWYGVGRIWFSEFADTLYLILRFGGVVFS